MASLKLSTYLISLVLLLILGAARAQRDPCEDAFNDCVLRFAGSFELEEFDIRSRGPDRAFTPNIVPKPADPALGVGIVNSNIEGEFILANGDVVPFSKLIPPGSGVQSLSPSFFKPYSPSTGGTRYSPKRFSGIGHEYPQPGQLRFVTGRCVRVFITEWQIIDPFPPNNVIDNVNGVTDRSKNVCVVFRTKPLRR